MKTTGETQVAPPTPPTPPKPVDAERAEKVKKLQSEIKRKYIEQYMKILDLDDYPKIKSALSKDTEIFQRYSHRLRITTNLQRMKYSYRQHRTNNICVCFKASSGGASASYAYLYAQYNPAGPEFTKYTLWCCGGSYDSQDGEYRARLLPFSRYTELSEKYAEAIAIAERVVVDRVASAALALHADFFYPSNFSGSERQFEDTINSQRLAIKFFVFAWLRDFDAILHNIIENHINATYRHVIFRAEDQRVYNDVTAAVGANNVAILRRSLASYSRKLGEVEAITPIECGQKIFPMTAFEAIKVHDINFAIWREIHISNMCTDLLLNFVSPSFPCINNWFFIENAHSGLFDNASMHVKYRNSTIATSISTQLRDIDKHNYVDKRRELGPINSRFMRLSKYMQKSLVYADSAIALTDLAVCVTSEFVGRTFRDITTVITRSPYYGQSRILSDIDSFSRHIFEYIYALFCMNTRLGLLHGDLHMNNVTLYRMYASDIMHGADMRPYILYILRDHLYLFPHYGLYSCIIDFSRAVFGDPQTLVEEFGERYAEIFMKEQRIRIMRILFTHFSKFMERNHADIERLLSSNLALMFKIITAIDPYIICTNMKILLTVDPVVKSGEVKLHGDIIKLLTKIADAAETFMIDNIKRAIDGTLTSSDDIEWPNYRILRKFFERYETTEDAIIANPVVKIADIFNYNNDLKYHIEEYDTWGPLLSLDIVKKAATKYKLEPTQAMISWEEFTSVDDTPQVDRLLDRYEQREQDVINIEPWMLY